jgi:hypothetical protein
LLPLRVRIPPGTWMSVCCECCVLSGRGLCDGIAQPQLTNVLVHKLWGKVKGHPTTGLEGPGGGGGVEV